jgi:hypothetical protein
MQIRQLGLAALFSTYRDARPMCRTDVHRPLDKSEAVAGASKQCACPQQTSER